LVFLQEQELEDEELEVSGQSWDEVSEQRQVSVLKKKEYKQEEVLLLEELEVEELFLQV
jgi:hypothetical protein